MSFEGFYGNCHGQLQVNLLNGVKPVEQKPKQQQPFTFLMLVLQFLHTVP